MYKFIDTHAHLYDEAFGSGQAEAAIDRASQAGVGVILQPDIDSKERESMFSLCDRWPGVLYPMLGLYPGSVDSDWEREITALEAWKGRKIAAIGEIGLDYHWSQEFKEQQKAALRVQLEMAAQMNLPVNIHLRDATEDFLSIVKDCSHLGIRGNMHAYSGSYETFCRLQDMGDWYVGIGGVVTYKNSKLPEVVKKIPLGRILLETDSPYLPPVPHRGERNEPSLIPVIAAKIAEIKGISPDEVAAVTTASAQMLFGLPRQ